MSHQRQDSGGSAYDPAAAQYHQHQMQLQQQQQYHIMPPVGHPPPLQHQHDPSMAQQQPMQQAHMHLLQSFWMNQMHDIENVPQDFKLHHLPLARIKKVMKTDEDVKVDCHPRFCLPSSRSLFLSPLSLSPSFVVFIVELTSLTVRFLCTAPISLMQLTVFICPRTFVSMEIRLGQDDLCRGTDVV